MFIQRAFHCQTIQDVMKVSGYIMSIVMGTEWQGLPENEDEDGGFPTNLLTMAMEWGQFANRLLSRWGMRKLAIETPVVFARLEIDLGEKCGIVGFDSPVVVSNSI